MGPYGPGDGSAHLAPVREHDSSRRWYDSSRVIWGLFAALGAIITFFTLLLWGMASGNQVKTGDQAERIIRIDTEVKAHRELLETKLQGVEREIRTQKEAVEALDVRQQRMEGKIDQVIQRLK